MATIVQRLSVAALVMLVMGLAAPAHAAVPAVATASPQPRAEILDTRTILPAGEPYAGWPTVARRRDGRLWLVWSGGREAHVCPFGQVRAMTSADDGATWTWPRVLLDGAIDDRDSGVVETARGTLLVTTFTSLAYEKPLGRIAADDPRRARWLAVHDRLDAAGRRAELGEWLIRSTDSGTTWSARMPTIVNSPHGPIQLADGRLLYAGKELWIDAGRIGVCESVDDGLTWRWLAEIPTRAGDDAKGGYHELHAVETADGRIVVQIRNHNQPHAGETLQSESADGGRTWSEPRAIGVWGLPSHLLRLRDDRLVMTYGHRRQPFGNQARVSRDHGRTWSEPLPISADGAAGDLGYPSTVELADGRLLTVWYEKPAAGAATLRQAVWRIVE
jgi:sialidase-1